MAEFIVKMYNKDIHEAVRLWLDQRGLKLKGIYAHNTTNKSIHPGNTIHDLTLEVILEEIPKIEGTGPYR